ncbi:TetR family transcriptional regulator [Enterococcus sp. BWR-S5]|uniref:TetR family transcriptional regulator n=1 Tax=Enterococcus sp. BWR-S5 TaxID=2787714 RepID=UPI0019212ECD|nr:TetR family transcriptional regulator [Enterococcus sp. BWR-S5]
MGDRRTVKSKKLILHAFEELLQEHSFEEISVTRLSEEAGISRNTFYIYYLDKYSLLDEQFSWFTKLCRETIAAKLSVGSWNRFLETLDTSGTILKGLLRAEETQWVKERIRSIFTKELLAVYTHSFSENKLTLRGCGEAMAGIVEWWLSATHSEEEKATAMEALMLFQALIDKEELFS